MKEKITVELIDARLAQIRSEMGKHNFCVTFEMMDIRNLENAKELLLKAEAMSKEDLVQEFVYLTRQIARVKNLVQSIAEQRNFAFERLGENDHQIKIDKMLKEYFGDQEGGESK
jgi:hypothetical protein